ncbi:hypothetical protein NTE_02228 [Candidatus Nitrososphaera evergladensis SR1]|uniref:Uncharacterized protein n=1 Tax=Candidatus Nitrososphaera evergladensis SR1 TaxID=1459636 RepID=A0A075MU92_9ARCH|nr:hypothetical protein [Candidatus Nitrososphaera evergladensis]AIF84282.1 hypothetical protein NTE_02228 [Candidatus Nitrososphaera evergladensis SR1]
MSCTLDDLKTAASSEGVNLIPFSDLRKEATSIADDIARRKEEVDTKGNVLTSQKDSKLWDIKQLNEKIANEEKVEATLRRQDDIDKWKKEIEDLNGKVKDINSQLDTVLDSARRLYDLRVSLREWFDKAKRLLSDLKSNPERALGSNPSDENKKELERCANEIISRIERGESGHKTAEDQVKRQVEKLKEALDKTEYK